MKKAVFLGVLGGLGLFGFYFLVMVLTTKSWEFPLRQFWDLKFLMGPLVLGFGVQVGLFWYLRLKHLENLGAKATVGGGAGVSIVSMVACCAHHLIEIIPILGLTVASIFVVKYQTQFLAFGILVNIVGIIIMARIIRKTKCQI